MQSWVSNSKKIKHIPSNKEFSFLFPSDAEALCEILNEYEEQESIEDEEIIIKKINNINKKMMGLSQKTRDLAYEMNNLQRELSHMKDMQKKIINEKKLGGNIHKDCEYYDNYNDTCSNYAMTGAGYEVSRFDKCVRHL